jgi:hypothetical protein
MHITNHANLPLPLVQALTPKPHVSRSDIGVTALIGPAQQAVLRKNFGDQIVVDVSDRIYMLMGMIIHQILEQTTDEVFVEHYTSASIDNWTVGGIVDYIDYTNKMITDWKVTSAWAVKDGIEAKPEWIAQLNIYRELLCQSGYPEMDLQVVALLRDWSKPEARRRPRDYPQDQSVTLRVPVWSRTDTISYIEERIALHRAARKAATFHRALPECTDEERWAKPDTYAVMKEGRKSALRVMPTTEAAMTWCAEHSHEIGKRGISIVHRPGSNTRCEMYCDVSPFCAQWKTIQTTPTP